MLVNPLLTKAQIYPFYDSELKKFGYVDSALNLVIKPIYKDAFPFQNDTAVVKLANGTHALISQKGVVVKRLIYNGLWGPYKNLIGTRIGKKFGVIDLAGRVVLKNVYDEIVIEDGIDTIIAKKDTGSESYYLYDGKLVRTVKVKPKKELEEPELAQLESNPWYDKLTYVYNDSYPRVVTEKGQFGYLSEDNRMLFKCQFTHASPFYNKVASVLTTVYSEPSKSRTVNGVLITPANEAMLHRVYVLISGKKLYK